MLSQSANNAVLTIVIPAYNEEEAIGDVLKRCLESRDEICQQAGLEAVEIVVVSDGSTDRTAEIARGFDEVRVVEFERNRGYGAAIQKGFAEGRGDLLSFLDADGTCDPALFGKMTEIAIDQRVDIVLGNRIHADSQMPAVRRLGNRLYALILGAMTGRRITDTATGMRVLWREAFQQLAPLPDGLHFTPAMTARALINQMRVQEIPIPYAERLGHSKLRVLTDGVRFLKAIIAGVLCYRPDRLLLIGFAVAWLAGVLLAAHPAEFYARHRELGEWMIYRLFASFLLGSSGYLLLCATALSHRMAGLGPTHRETDSFVSTIVASLFEGKWLAVGVITSLVLAIAVLWPGIVEFVSHGTCTLHWSRLFVGAFFLLAIFQALITAILLRVVKIWGARLSFQLRDQSGIRALPHSHEDRSDLGSARPDLRNGERDGSGDPSYEKAQQQKAQSSQETREEVRIV